MGVVDIILQSAITLSGGVAAYLLLRSKVHKDAVEETEKLADARGDRIADMEKELVRLSGRVLDLEGQLRALQQLKVDQIISGVIDGLA